MQEAELKYADRLKNGTPHNFAELLGSDSSKKRKRRTSFTPQALEILADAFEKNSHPSGSDMTVLANKLSYDREVIRVWFCNKRQALKNTVKKFKSDDPFSNSNDLTPTTNDGEANLLVSSIASTSNSDSNDDSNNNNNNNNQEETSIVVSPVHEQQQEINNQQQQTDILSAAVAAAVAAATSN